MSQYLNDYGGYQHEGHKACRLLLGCTHAKGCNNTQNCHSEFKTLNVVDTHAEGVDYNGDIKNPSFYDQITNKFSMIYSERCCGVGQMFGSIADFYNNTDPKEKEKCKECLEKMIGLLEVGGVFVVRFCDPGCPFDMNVSDHIIANVMKMGAYVNMERLTEEDLEKTIQEIEKLDEHKLPNDQKNLEVTLTPLFNRDDSENFRKLIKNIDVNSNELFLGSFTPKEYLNLCKKYGNDVKKIIDDCADINPDRLPLVNTFMRNIEADVNNTDLKNIMQKFRNFTINPDCEFDSDEEFFKVCDIGNLLNTYCRYMPRFIAYRRKF